MPEQPYLELSIRVFREDGFTAVAMIGKRQIATTEGAHLSDVLIALVRGVAKSLG